ncbi:hypothetical protein D0B54_19660 [Solimonas sp. K1W22B-7]|uniref:tetratricopeptide repeat protein n=1 Tax=Solimonas sp. K1W22B-7 TaxID=2303331 RepID=UPI000E3320C8|nr:tetratricopeptide repeat protein [Solimonas sp. K1W22B-7]AXQ30763.1 hypothetical protein D0B54_19660 [Solimonas sp. K1W22B-7]
MRSDRPLALLLACLLLPLAGCATLDGGDAPATGMRPSSAAAAAAPVREDEPLAEANEKNSAAVVTELIRGMLQQEQYYAALAHIQQQRGRQDSAELRFLEGEAQRHLGRTVEADKLYRGLLRGDYAAQAYRGLGLLHAGTNLPVATQFLREAVQREPTSAEMRSDLGYALMSAGRYREALPEIATAVELDRNSLKARNNLILLLILTRDEAGVKKVAEAGDVSAQALAKLRKQAQDLSTRIAMNRGAP